MRNYVYLKIIIAGFVIGYVMEILTTEQTEPEILPLRHHSKRSINNTMTQSTESKVKKTRIICFLNTMPKSHSKKAIHITKTWGKHCDKLFFSSTLTDLNINALGFNVTDDHQHMWGKVKLMLQYIHRHYHDEYDWVFKGDDDTFMIPENMRYMLSAYSPEDPIYFGYKFNTSEHKWGYFSGGSGYVMSKNAVRVFVDKVLTNPMFLNEIGAFKGCDVGTDERVEDWDITRCLDLYNVYAGDSRDEIKRERFLIFWPQAHFFGYPDPNYWYWQRKYYWTDEGLDCCSNYTVAFHYIGPANQYSNYFTTYKLRTYGLDHRYPLPPIRKPFSEVALRLDRERVDKKLRGY